MSVFLYLAVLCSALYWVAKTLLPEMLKSSMPESVPMSKAPEVLEKDTSDAENRIQKLELLLAEKNKNISLLQTELKMFHVQVCNFDKIKSLLQEEIYRLREQNRIFRSELGMPTVPSSAEPKENSTRLFL